MTLKKICRQQIAWKFTQLANINFCCVLFFVLCSSFRDQQLGTILNILKGMLGRDDSRRKTFVRFWSNFGYPVAFKTKQEAENHVNLMKLLNAVDVSKESSELMSSRMVKAIVCRRQFILQKIEHLFSILEGDQANQGKLVHFQFVFLFFE